MNILIILPNWIGDVVMSLPTVKKSREIFKNDNIYILIRKEIFPLIEENCDTLNILPIFYKDKNFKTTLNLIKAIKKKKFHKAFILPRSYRMFIISLFSNIKELYGYGDLFKNIFLTKSLKRDNHSLSKHRVFYYLDVLNLYKHFDYNNLKPQLILSNKCEEWAENFLKNEKINNKILIGINPGATYGEAKCWKKENFLKLIDKLNNKFSNLQFLIFGGKDNSNYNSIFNNIKNCLNLTGKLTIDKSAALIKMCKIFITNDTGPMHIADALNVEIIAIFGPTDPEETPPFTKREHLLYKHLDCSPCKERICPKSNNKCMESITVEEVYDKVIKLIDG